MHRMLRRAVWTSGLMLSCLTLASCTQQPTGGPSPQPSGEKPPSGPGEKPSPPLSLSEPSPPPPILDGQNLQKLGAGALASRASQAAARGDYRKAAQLQHWAAARDPNGRHRYNLACYYARMDSVDAAFYWLQIAALEEGVGASHAQADNDLVSLRRDPRWSQVRGFLVACEDYWPRSGVTKTPLVLPRDYRKQTPITVIVWLHGFGSHPGDYVNDDLQDEADELNVAFVGVSATVPKGPMRFEWSEEPDRDAKRILDALGEVSDRLTVKPGRLIAMGFSQGAQVALEMAVRDPDRYAGAIVLSPGAAFRSNGLKEVSPSPLLAKRGFVLAYGEKDVRANARVTDAAWLRDAKVGLLHLPYAGVSKHSFPPDFEDRFPEWLQFIEKARER